MAFATTVLLLTLCKHSLAMQTRGMFSSLTQSEVGESNEDEQTAANVGRSQLPTAAIQTHTAPSSQAWLNSVAAGGRQASNIPGTNIFNGVAGRGGVDPSQLNAGQEVSFQQPQSVAASQLNAGQPGSVPNMFAASSDTAHSLEAACIPQCSRAQVPAACQPVCSRLAHGGHCSPQCSWKCESQACDEVCEPTCAAPQCETRCQGIDVSGCQMDCNKPQCAVVCPRRSCASGSCPTCKATCSQPLCHLKCNNTQPCHNVCEHPKCSWKCKAPEKCPAPKCHMVCESPPSCMGSTYKKLPALQANEFSVRAFSAPGTGKASAKLMQVPMVSRPSSTISADQLSNQATNNEGDGLLTRMVSVRVR